MEGTAIRSADGSAAVSGRNWLCVDLDGTLIKSDLLMESALRLIKQNPLTLLLLPAWLARGKAHLKARVAERVELDAETLPYNDALIGWLRQEKRKRRKMCLATASHHKLATQVASHLGLFDAVIATDTINLKGDAKARALIARHGEQGFDYVGNDHADIAVWRHARRRWAVGELRRAYRKLGVEMLPVAAAKWTPSTSALFVPALAAHAFDPATLTALLAAFLSFGLCASSVYVLNDVLDLTDDRAHARKRERPFAAGDLPLAQGLAAIPILAGAAVLLALATLPPTYLAILIGYFAATVAYSLRLKRIALADVFTLAALYTTRLVAGAAATGIALSFWLIALSIFGFLSLALLKRYAEQIGQLHDDVQAGAGRGYTASDMQILAALGGASGFVSILVLALYVNSPEVLVRYSQPEVIWLVCPLLLYWMSRAWLLAHRNQMHDDPVVFAATDPASWVIAALIAAAAVIAA